MKQALSIRGCNCFETLYLFSFRISTFFFPCGVKQPDGRTRSLVYFLVLRRGLFLPLFSGTPPLVSILLYPCRAPCPFLFFFGFFGFIFCFRPFFAGTNTPLSPLTSVSFVRVTLHLTLLPLSPSPPNS